MNTQLAVQLASAAAFVGSAAAATEIAPPSVSLYPPKPPLPGQSNYLIVRKGPDGSAISADLRGEYQVSGSVLPIVKWPSPLLSTVTTPVENPEDQAALIGNLVATCRDRNGLGIAAPQVGSLVRVAVIDLRAVAAAQRIQNLWGVNVSHLPWLALINPVVDPVTQEGKISGTEGCLSNPGVTAQVKRYSKVLVDLWLERDGKLTPIGNHLVTGLLSRVVQHEVDHLYGVNFMSKAVKGTLRRSK